MAVAIRHAISQRTSPYYKSTTTQYYKVLLRTAKYTETSSALRGATYGMQNTIELHSRLIVTTHEASSAVGGANYVMQSAM